MRCMGCKVNKSTAQGSNPICEECFSDRFALINRAITHFSEEMRKKLVKNIHKREWTEMPLDLIVERLLGEVSELKVAIRYETPEDVQAEAADIANFALFVFDRSRKEQEKATTKRKKRT
jgi:NTP pyrophosphatase (non-canonical NTP hydrolase)